MLLLTATVIERLMPAQAWVDEVSRAYVAYSDRSAQSPLRTRIHLSPWHEGRTAFMPGFVGETGALGCKIVGYYPGNAARGLPAVEGVVILIDPETGAPEALVDGTRLTELRTGAIVAAGVQHLCGPRAPAVGLFGSGALARTSLLMLRETCGLETVHVYSRSPERREDFAREIRERLGIEVTACSSPEEVLEATTLLVCATATREPVFPGAALRKGSVVISIGANTPQTREIDEETIGAGALVVESRQATLAECGELIIPISAGRMDASVIDAEIGEIIAGTKPRPAAGETVVFKSTGLAVQDMAIARELARRAMESGEGERIRLRA